MKTYKDTYPGFDSQSAIESEIQKAETEISSRNKGKNFPFKSKTWALEMVRLGTEWEFIDKTIEEDKQDEADEAKLDAEIKEENDRADLLIQASSDPVIRDQLIFSEMNKAGFTLEKVSFAHVALVQDGKLKPEFWEARAAAKQAIVDEIEAAG